MPAEDFKLTNPQFDPTAKPDTKKENPHVLQMGTYQVDLIRGSMKGFDIVPGTDGEQMIAVIYGKKTEAQDQEKLRALSEKFKKGRKGKKGPPKAPPGNVQRPPGLPGPGGPGGPPGGGGLGGGGLGGGGLGGDNPYGGPGGFQFGAQRVEKAIEYVPVAQLDAAIAKQKVPAMTVIPVRMVTVHAEIPLKRADRGDSPGVAAGQRGRGEGMGAGLRRLPGQAPCHQLRAEGRGGGDPGLGRLRIRG